VLKSTRYKKLFHPCRLVVLLLVPLVLNRIRIPRNISLFVSLFMLTNFSEKVALYVTK